MSSDHQPAALANWETKYRCTCGMGDFVTRQELHRHIANNEAPGDPVVSQLEEQP